MDTNPLTLSAYAIAWEAQTSLKDAIWLPGVGDHGGGPTRDMLQVAERWQHSPFFPRLEFTKASRYLSRIRSQLSVGKAGASNKETTDKEQLTTDIPIWNDELYLEFHRGCYTTHADQKRWNRYCEGLLYQAELFASLATLTTGSSYPKTQLEAAWKKVLFNQFHDILPGTSIPDVFVEANQAWQEVEQVGAEILAASLGAIASQITLPPPPQPDAQPVIVFNPLNWQRSELVAVPLPNSTPSQAATAQAASTDWEIYDLSGQKLLSQLTEESTLLFLAKDIPSVGYRVFWLCPITKPQPPAISIPIREDFVLENECLRVIVNPATGDLSSVFDKIQQREILSGAGNQLQAFQDSGQYWDAWNIDPNYAQYPLPPSQLKSIEWLERGVLRSRLRVVRQIGQSAFCQDYVLDAESSVLKIATTVDWQERHVVVKAAFPLNLEANFATYEIPCGAIQRPTQPQTAAEQAKWEVPALHWADLSAQKHGVSLLNDCKYGYDANPSQLRLTLLRSPSWPDPEADRGIHQFSYALYPHQGSWQAASTVQRGYELNLPLIVFNPHVEANDYTSLQPIGRLLDLQSDNLILMALKQSEDVPNHWIARCYECQGESADLTFGSDLELRLAYFVDLLERPTHTSQPLSTGESLRISPWKIASFAICLSSAALRDRV